MGIERHISSFRKHIARLSWHVTCHLLESVRESLVVSESESQRVFTMNKIPQGIGAVSLNFETKAPFPYVLFMMDICLDESAGECWRVEESVGEGRRVLASIGKCWEVLKRIGLHHAGKTRFAYDYSREHYEGSI